MISGSSKSVSVCWNHYGVWWGNSKFLNRKLCYPYSERRVGHRVSLPVLGLANVSRVFLQLARNPAVETMVCLLVLVLEHAWSWSFFFFDKLWTLFPSYILILEIYILILTSMPMKMFLFGIMESVKIVFNPNFRVIF